ncbi:MAG: hypothetical protein WKF84_23860 [Pyrinomonadaceae bacterium]
MKRLLLLLILAVPSFADAQIHMSTALIASAEAVSPKAPELWNFRLGLTLQEVQQRYPAMAVGRTDEFGITPGSIGMSVNNRYQHNMAGLDHVVLAFVDGRLAHYSASLTTQTYYLDIDAYAARMSSSLQLPNAWQQSNKLPGALMLNCAGFEVFVFTHPQPGIGMTDTSALNKVLQRWKGNVRTADRIPFSYY